MKKLALILILFASPAFADDNQTGSGPDAATDLLTRPAPASPVPMLQSMIGGLAGQLAQTQAQLQDAQARITQLEKHINKPKTPADQENK